MYIYEFRCAPSVSSPKSRCQHIEPLCTFSFQRSDTADSPTRPSVSELFLSLQMGTSSGPFFISKGAGRNIFNLPLDPGSMTDSHTLLLVL